MRLCLSRFRHPTHEGAPDRSSIAQLPYDIPIGAVGVRALSPSPLEQRRPLQEENQAIPRYSVGVEAILHVCRYLFTPYSCISFRGLLLSASDCPARRPLTLSSSTINSVNHPRLSISKPLLVAIRDPCMCVRRLQRCNELNFLEHFQVRIAPMHCKSKSKS
jgi:hypothetical protein